MPFMMFSVVEILWVLSLNIRISVLLCGGKELLRQRYCTIHPKVGESLYKHGIITELEFLSVLRALVFIIVIVLYSQLFRFLRRPDTVEIVSLNASGDDGTGTRRGSQGSVNGLYNSAKAKIAGFTVSKSEGDANDWPLKDLSAEVPPWEKLHISYAGSDLNAFSSLESDGPRREPARKGTESTLVSSSASRKCSDDLIAERGEKWKHAWSESGTPTEEIEITLEYIPENQILDPGRVSGHPITPMSIAESNGSLTELVPKAKTAPEAYIQNTSRRVSIDANAILADERKVNQIRATNKSGLGLESDEEEAGEGVPGSKGFKRRQTLEEFFAENQASIGELEERARRAQRHNGGDGLEMQQSAASYFNKQASLLMLYFPIAYLIVFTFSVVRLLYDMITQKPNAVLTILSLWFVLSVGLVDALVYVSIYMSSRSMNES